MRLRTPRLRDAQPAQLASVLHYASRHAGALQFPISTSPPIRVLRTAPLHDDAKKQSAADSANQAARRGADAERLPWDETYHQAARQRIGAGADRTHAAMRT